MILHEKVQPYNIILASNSPRRKQFLTDLGLRFSVKPVNINEKYPYLLKDKDIALYIAHEKAKAFNDLNKNDLLITCDTIVWIDDIALGKPENKEQAIAMLTKLSGKTHQVISAVCLKSTFKEDLFFDVTDVTFNNLNSKDINYYIDTYQPFDKAGSYGIQEWIGLIGIEKISGSYTNVVGMPMEKLYQHLKNF